MYAAETVKPAYTEQQETDFLTLQAAFFQNRYFKFIFSAFQILGTVKSLR